MSARDHAHTARELYEAFNRHDVERCLELATEDVEVVLTPFGQTFHGREGFRNFMEGFLTAFPDLTITLTNQAATDDGVVNEFRWTGTHSGPLQSPTGEIPATGKSVEGAVACEVWEMRDGSLAALRNYQDVSTWLRQLGLVP